MEQRQAPKPAPRQIDISRARRRGAMQAPAVRAAQSCRPAPQQAARPGARPAPGTAAARNGARPAARRGKGRRGRGKTALAAAAGALCVLCLCAGGLYLYAKAKLNGGNAAVQNASGVNELVPPELQEEQMNLLVIGLDYDDEQNANEAELGVVRSKENPMADMLLYVQYNKSTKQLRMLQVPRDMFVVTDESWHGYTMGTGKINAVFAHGPNENKVQNIVDVFNQQLKLPVDHYITIDMEHFKDMFAAFGGEEWALEVYVPTELNYYKDGVLQSHLEPGYQYLKAEELEFFLRCREDLENTPRGDFDRLNNQRYFYSALFRYMRTMSVGEMMRLVPWALNYVETDIDPVQCVALALSVMEVPDENISMGRLPMYGKQTYYNTYHYVSDVAPRQAADFLNQYFRAAEAPVSAEELHFAANGGAEASNGIVIDAEMSHIGGDGMVEQGAGAQSGAPQSAGEGPA